MPNLKVLIGNFGFSHKDIETIDGFSSLEKVTGEINVGNSTLNKDKLEQILAFKRVKSVKSLFINSVNVISNPFYLKSLKGFDSLEIVEDILSIRRFAGVRLNGFKALKKIGKVFYLQECPNLLTLEGLENLREIGAQWETSFLIADNNSLHDISALSGAKVKANVYALFWILRNPSLEICHIPMVCDFIAQNKFESFNIHTNAPGCQSKDEVKTACLTSSDDSADLPAISIFPNPVTDVVRLVSSAPLRSVTLYDISGKKIYHDTTGSAQIDMSTWDRGWYFMEIQLSDGTFHKLKVVKLF
ncbi:MAG: T9SS type A sorting domain-containing protein [Saprospiraceae bacterium]|nr:T9SS type A sorting domain-containing protein [Saprospiraceae bacterium]